MDPEADVDRVAPVAVDKVALVDDEAQVVPADAVAVVVLAVVTTEAKAMECMKT